MHHPSIMRIDEIDVPSCSCVCVCVACRCMGESADGSAAGLEVFDRLLLLMFDCVLMIFAASRYSSLDNAATRR